MLTWHRYTCEYGHRHIKCRYIHKHTSISAVLSPWWETFCLLVYSQHLWECSECTWFLMNMCWMTGWGSNETMYTVLRLGLTKSSNFWIRNFERRPQLCVYQVLQMILTNSQIWACTHLCGSDNMGDLTEIYDIKEMNLGLPGGPVLSIHLRVQGTQFDSWSRTKMQGGN